MERLLNGMWKCSVPCRQEVFDNEEAVMEMLKEIKGLKIAIPKEFYGEGIDAEIRDSVMQAARVYESMGAQLVECSMPSLKYAVAATVRLKICL